MPHDFLYTADLSPEPSGGFVVTVPDFPEVITQAEEVGEALEQAADALEEAVAGRVRRGDDIPLPSQLRPGQYLVHVPASTAAKAALYLALRETGLTKTQLATKLGCDEKEVRRLLDPRHRSKLPRIEKALAALGKTIAIRLVDEAA